MFGSDYDNPTSLETNNFKADFSYNVVNCDLEARFETQFYKVFQDVTLVDVHHNDGLGYYYAVYGKDSKGKSIVEYFKTTSHEVANQTYDYIEMNERTMNGSDFCRSIDRDRDYLCSPFYSGPVCGIRFGQWGCILY